MRLSPVMLAFAVATAVSTTCKGQLSDVLVLTLSANSKSDQTIVRFLSGASDMFDSAYDAYKMMNPDPTPNIYTVSDQYYAINALPLYDGFHQKSINLHVRAAFPAVYTITAKELGAFDSTWSIQLTDHFLQQDIDLRNTPVYSFTADTTDPYHRFTLTFTRSQAKSSVITEASLYHPTDIDHMIYVNQENIVVDAGNEVPATIYVNDLEGHLVCPPAASSGTWTFCPNKAGLYLVHVASNQGHWVKKVMIQAP